MTALSSFLPADVSTGIRNAIDANPSLTGVRWRVSEGPYPLTSSPVCLLLQFRNGTAWNTVQAIDPTGRLLVQQAWQAPTLLNSWVQYGLGFASAEYYRDTSGIVHLQGAVKNGTINTTVFTLPIGYRPATNVICPGWNNSAFCVITVTNNGSVIQGLGISTAHLGFNSVSFRAEQ